MSDVRCKKTPSYCTRAETKVFGQVPSETSPRFIFLVVGGVQGKCKPINIVCDSLEDHQIDWDCVFGPESLEEVFQRGGHFTTCPEGSKSKPCSRYGFPSLFSTRHILHAFRCFQLAFVMNAHNFAGENVCSITLDPIYHRSYYSVNCGFLFSERPLFTAVYFLAIFRSRTTVYFEV